MHASFAKSSAGFGATSSFGGGRSTMRSTAPSIGTITPAVGMRSSCGNQVKSTVASNPSYGMGTATRENLDKRFISEEHKAKEAPTWTPGPGAYSLPPSLANYANAKPPAANRSGKKKPLSYNTQIGKQQSSTVESTEAWRFGTQERFATKQSTVPGPGAYFT